MDSDFYDLCGKLVDPRYVRQGQDGRRRRQTMIQHLLQHKKIPDDPWDDCTIELLLKELSLMDSNNFVDQCGAGEREGRVFSSLVAQRHFRLSHGIGRSGDVTAIQPKAAGSSVMAKLTNALALDALRIAGIINCHEAFVVPVATGMSIVLSLLTLKKLRPLATRVIWPRIDQKSCFKAIGAAGLTPVIVDLKIVGDQLETDVEGIQHAIENDGGPSTVLCILTTTSCFAPRAPDDLVAVASVAATLDIPHIVNNAYGVQASKCVHLLERASRTGRIDAFVQSTDKNFMVPVGGAIIAGFGSNLISQIAQTYPGRASSSPSIDLLVTLLSMGKSGYRRLLKERKENFERVKNRLREFAESVGERLLDVPANPTSMAMTLTTTGGARSDDDRPTSNGNDDELMKLDVSSSGSLTDGNVDMAAVPKASDSGDVETELGSMLFTRCVSGARVISGRARLTVDAYEFEGWGAHHALWPHGPYLTAGVGIGMTNDEVLLFFQRLDKVFRKWKKR